MDGFGPGTIDGVQVYNVALADEGDEFEDPVDASDGGAYLINLIYRVQYEESIPTPH